MHEGTILISFDESHSYLLFDVTDRKDVFRVQDENVVRDFMDREYYSKEWDRYEAQATEYILPFEKNWNDVKFFEEKFDELKEKEMNGTLSEFEKKLLYEVVDKRLLAFDNPFLPKDHTELMAAKNEYRAVVNEFNEKYKSD